MTTETQTDALSILLVEDNDEITYGLRNNLEIEGYTVSIADDGPQGLEKALHEKFDLIILDLMLPTYDGYYVLSKIRNMGNDTPVLILSAKGEELDKVQGFRLGADDYVTKPFGTMELLVRIEAILRRSRNGNQGEPEEYWAFSDVEVYSESRKVLKNGLHVSMTPLEFDLLVALLRRNGKVAPREELLKEVWGHNGEIHSRTVDTHIAELRNKIEDYPSKPQFIKTVPKIGYRMEV